jgi:uncharacterized protein YbaP (TraB family)
MPLDEALRQRAASTGKEIAFLEDWKFQLDVLSKLITVDDLREMLDPDSKGRRLLIDMMAAYRAGDLEKMAALTLDPEEIAKNPERHAELFDRRNRDWVPKLAPHLSRGRTFVAVGAGHYVGEQGLIELLRAEGYVLTRVVKP